METDRRRRSLRRVAAWLAALATPRAIRRLSLAAPALGLAALVAAIVPSVVTAAAPTWRLEQPPPPAGAPFKVPLGPPGDLQFWAPNRGLLAVEGNATIPRGLFVYDGAGWRQLATVCGGSGDTTRIAWAGPREFWTVTQPSQPRVGSGTALCHFRDGQVVGSYSTPPEAQDPFRQLFAAACDGPDDCWFGGVGSQDPIGERIGAFHLHWDGTSLTTSYNPQGRGVSDLEAADGTIFESVLAGRRPESRDPADVAAPESPPRLIHRVGAAGIVSDPFTSVPLAGVPPEGTELLGLDSDGQQLWAVGGGAASGPSAPEGGGPVSRPPLAARLSDGVFEQVPLDAAAFAAGERFVDVAALPGSTGAWVAVQPFAERQSTNAKAKVALLDADGATTTLRLPVSGSGRGSAARIACPGPADCWLATYAGWLFHYTDGTPLARDTDPAFGSVISFRPNEAAEQFLPDSRPADDSQLFAPPPVEVQQAQPPRRTKRLPALIRRIRSKLHGRTLRVTFTLTRRARVALVARRKRTVVARTRRLLLPRGRRLLELRLDPHRWPTRLSFQAREPGQGGGGGDDTVVTTGATR